jgi:hypothetical protein
VTRIESSVVVDVGMKMVEGPWFFASFAGGWRFAPVAERIGAVVLRRDIDRRIAGFARGCADPVVVAAVTSSGA